MDSADEEPDPLALERVRADLAELGSDEASAPDVPPAVTARVVAALRSAPGGGVVQGASAHPMAAHSTRPPRLPRIQVLAAAIGVCAAVVAAVVGAVMLTRGPSPASSAGPTAELITVSRSAQHIPLSDPQIVSLLTRSPDLGPLAEPPRRASCLSGLGYSAATKVLGAQPVDMSGRPGVLILLPGDTPTAVVALVVEPNCSSAHTGLLASTMVTRP